MKVVVGSGNPVKIKAVRDGLGRFYEVEVEGARVESGVSDQPITLEEIQLGAINRARKALEKGGEWGVGIEAGIVQASNTITNYVDVAWCAIVDSEGGVTVGSSPQFEWPPHFVAHAEKGKEIGLLSAKLTGDPDAKRKEGGIGFLSKGAIPRKDFCEMAVVCAAIPRLHPELYGLEGKDL